MNKYWEGFNSGEWSHDINVRDFIQQNYTPYHGGSDFLAEPTNTTINLWNKVLELMDTEQKNGILDVETKTPSSVLAYGTGYIDKDLEVIVGLQTDAPLKRGIMPKGGIRVVKNALKSYGYELDKNTERVYTNDRKTHNDGVYGAYTDAWFRKESKNIVSLALKT